MYRKRCNRRRILVKCQEKRLNPYDCHVLYCGEDAFKELEHSLMFTFYPDKDEDEDEGEDEDED